MNDRRIRGLYVITRERKEATHDCVQQVRLALDGGAQVVQYREKKADARQRLHEARVLSRLCKARGVPLIINDDPWLARRVGAAGVHLGKSDLPLAEARHLLGSSAIIGVSCYDELERAHRAEAMGASYVAFGSFFPSPTKPEAVRASLALLRAARRELRLPIVAIGGITPENGASLVAAGADALAVIEGVFGREDIESAARRYHRLFSGLP